MFSILDKLLRICIIRMLPHVWVKILPSSQSDVDNFAFSIGQDWESMLLLWLNYLEKYKNEIRLNVLKCEELELKEINGAAVKIGSGHIKNSKKIYYICYNYPVHKYPC